jgi:heavy metal efflux system protein
VKDIARIRVGHTPRQGIAGRDDDADAVLAIVLMNRAERTLEVIDRVKAKAAQRNEIMGSGKLSPRKGCLCCFPALEVEAPPLKQSGS